MGKIVSLPVAEGDRVRAGQLLARIDAGAGAERRVRRPGAGAALEPTQRGAAEQVRAAEPIWRPPRRARADAEQQFARSAGLFETQGLLPVSEFDTARAPPIRPRAAGRGTRRRRSRAGRARTAPARRVAQARAQARGARDSLPRPRSSRRSTAS